MADPKAFPNIKEDLAQLRKERQGAGALDVKADLAEMRSGKTRAPSPGTAGYDYVNIDKTEPGIVEADALESLTNEFIQTRGMNVVDARKEAERKLNEMRIADEGAAQTTRAKSAKLAAGTPDMTTYGVGVRTFGARVVPESQLGMSPGERDQAWREDVAANEAGLGGGMEQLRKVASSLAEAEAPPMSEAEAREAGIVRPWMDKIHTGLARMANAAMDLDGDEAVVGAHELWDGIAGYAEDKDVQAVVSASGAADIAKRAYMKSGLPDVVVSAKEAATMTAADTARAIDLDQLAERIERVGVSRADAQRAHQYIMDAQPLPDFDAVGDNLVKQPEEIAIDSAWEASAHMTPAEVPDRDVAGHFKVSEWRERLAQNEGTRANPEFAAAWDAIDKGMDDGRLEWALRSVSYGSLREVDPSFGPKGIDLVNLAKRRESARLATGGKASGSTEKLFTAALIGAVTNDAGETVYVERTTGQIMRIAGTFAEGVYESDLKLGDSIAFWQVPMLAAVADMAGAEDLGRKIRNVRVPTKAGLDQMAQTGYYDDVYYSLGLTRPRALRVKNETTSSPRETLARVFADVQNPAFQGLGYTDAYVRAGGNPIDGIAQSLSFVDVAIDFANPIDDFMFDAGGQLVRRPSRAAAAASVAAPGMRKVAAVTAAFPEVMLGKAKRAAAGAADVMKVGKDTDTDAVLRDIVLAETRRMINEGEAVDLTAFESPEFDDAARSIGVDSTMLRDEVVKAIEFSRGRVLTRAKQMLDNGVTPEVEALRKTPTWARRKAEVDALVAADLAPGDPRSFTPEKADMMMRWEEAMALASADIGTPFVTKGNPEQYLGRQGRVVGGTSGPGAYFQDDGAVRAATRARLEAMIAAGESRVGAARKILDELPRRIADMTPEQLAVREELTGRKAPRSVRAVGPTAPTIDVERTASAWQMSDIRQRAQAERRAAQPGWWERKASSTTASDAAEAEALRRVAQEGPSPEWVERVRTAIAAGDADPTSLVFHSIIGNRGTFDPRDPNILNQRVNGQIRGSIERPAQTVGWLQRYYSGANADTVFHENGHGTRFIFGDDWTDELAKHFDHTIDPQTNRPVLTRKGEEQAAEAWRWYQRTKMNPDGTVQGLFDVAFIALDRFWFAMRNKLTSTIDAPTLPGGLAAYWDALLNPGARAQRAAIAIGDVSLPRFVDTVRASDDPAVNVVAATAERAGKTRQMTRIDALPDDIRAEIGIEEGIVEMDPVELYARLLAKVTVDKYKSRGWGSEPYVRIGSTRTAVPQSRVKRILDDVTAKKVQAFGAKAPPVKGNVLDLDPNQRAGLAGLINEINRSPLGNTLPERIRSFDPLNPTATFAVADMKIVDDALVDIHAGANARRSYAAENLVSAPMVTKVLRLFSDTVTDAEVYRNAVTKMQSYFSDKLINAFGATGMEKYAGPALRELVEEMRREMGQISSDVTGEMMQNTSAGNRLRIRFLQDAVGKETSVIDPLLVDRLGNWQGWFKGNIGTVEGGRDGADVHGAVADLFAPWGTNQSKVLLAQGVGLCPMDDLEHNLALTPHAGGVGLTPLESGAVQALRGNEAARLVAGVDVPTWLAQPGNAETISDALGILQRGTKLRWAAFLDEVENLMSAAAGSNDRIVMTAINQDLVKSFYRDFWEASDDSWTRMFSTLTDLGQKVSGPSFNQSQAVLAMLMRLRVRRIFNRLGERLLAAGIAISPDIALTLSIKRGASYVDEIGHHGMFGFDGERQRVHDVLNQMVGWKERPITKGHHSGTTYIPTGSVTPGKIDVSTPEGRRAYTIGTRVLAALGWQFGKGSFGEGLVMLPNGQELYMPEMMAKYIAGTMDETAKLGGAFAGAMRGGWLSDSWNTLSKAVARGEETGAHVLNLSGVDSELGQLTPMLPEQLTAKSRRETAQAAGVTAGAVIGAALAGWPGGIVGGIAGRNIIPHAIEAGGSLAAKWRRSTGAIGGATGAVLGGGVGTVIGAVKTVSDALSVLYPITMGMSRVGMTAGLIVPHAAFYVANVFGATFQTYLRTGLRGVARTAKQFLPWFGEPAMIGRVLSDMADWNNVAQLLPDPKPFLTDAGGIWTYEMLIDAVKRVGLDSSFVKSQSTNQIANVMRSLFGERWEKFKAHPFDTAAEPFGYVQNGLMELASAVDNANRVGVFIAELKRGVGVEEAGKIAREAAFDYGNLSEFERTVLRPVVLFYSYLRQSVGLFWNTAITNPGRIIGALRASRGLRYDEAEEPDITLPESLDTKLLLWWEESKAQGHANQGVATVSPPMTVDVFPLYAEILGLFTGDSDDWRKVVIGHLDPTFQFMASVGPYGIDPFSGMNVNDYNTIPGWLVDMDRDLTGGLLYDMLDIHEMQQSDPAKADYPGAPRFQAGNGKLWWFLRNKVQVPPFGRYLDEMAGYDRWAPLGGAGPVTAAVKAAHAYRENGGDPALDAFFAGPVRHSIAWMPGIGFDINRPMVQADTNVEVVEDVMTPRDDVSRTKEGLGVIGVKTVVVPNLENVDARGVTTSMRAMEDAKKTAEKTDDTRYQ